MVAARAWVRVVRNMLIGATCFVIIGTLLPFFFDIVSDPANTLRINDMIVDYNEMGVSTYTWDRWSTEDLFVTTYMDLEKLNNGDEQIWSDVMPDVFFQKGAHVFVFSFNEFPMYLCHGRYQVVGTSAYYTSLGVRKTVPFSSAIFEVP